MRYLLASFLLLLPTTSFAGQLPATWACPGVGTAYGAGEDWCSTDIEAIRTQHNATDAELDNEASLEAALGALNIILDSEIDTSPELLALLTDETGTGALVFGTSPTIVTPTIASFVNAAHSHLNAAGGGTITEAAISDLAHFSPNADPETDHSGFDSAVSRDADFTGEFTIDNFTPTTVDAGLVSLREILDGIDAALASVSGLWTDSVGEIHPATATDHVCDDAACTDYEIQDTGEARFRTVTTADLEADASLTNRIAVLDDDNATGPEGCAAFAAGEAGLVDGETATDDLEICGFDGNTLVDVSSLEIDQFDIVLESPAATDDFLFAKATGTLTIQRISCIVDPGDTGESVVIQIMECDGSAPDTCAGVDGATTISCGNTDSEDDGALSNATIDDDDWLQILTNAPTGTVSFLSVTVEYTRDDD